MHKVVKQKRDLSIHLYNWTDVQQWNELSARHRLSPKTLPQQLATSHSKPLSLLSASHPSQDADPLQPTLDIKPDALGWRWRVTVTPGHRSPLLGLM